MHIEFCAKLNFLEGEYAIMQNIGFLLSWVGNPCRYLVLRPCKIRTDFVDALLAAQCARGKKIKLIHRRARRGRGAARLRRGLTAYLLSVPLIIVYY